MDMHTIMLNRRAFVASCSVVAPTIGVVSSARGLAAPAIPGRYENFLASIRRQALADGLNAQIVGRALAMTQAPNAHVLKLDRHQPEFTLTWAQYRQRVISPSRITEGQAAFRARDSLLARIERQYGVDARVIVGIWGLESGFGRKIGTFSVIDALATLAYDGRRASFFRSELLKALRILNDRDITPEGMMGSYAGAMGQPQFMPSAYLSYAVDGDGDGRRDIWKSEADVFASIANYLKRCGWVAGAPWGQPVTLTRDIAQTITGRGNVQSLAQWAALGVRRADGSAFSRPDVQGALLRPDGAGGEAFIVYKNFNVIRRYNPSDFYALGVGLLGYAVA